MSLDIKGRTLFAGQTSTATNKELKGVGAKHIGGGQYAYKTPYRGHTLYFKVETNGALIPIAANDIPFAYLENPFPEMFNRLIVQIELARKMVKYDL